MAEQLIVRLALFSGMRPGEILALQWKHIADDHVEVVHRIYRGKLDRPKSERSKRTVALSSTTQNLMTQWRQQIPSSDPDAWVFPSAKLTTPERIASLRDREEIATPALLDGGPLNAPTCLPVGQRRRDHLSNNGPPPQVLEWLRSSFRSRSAQYPGQSGPTGNPD